LGRPCAPWIPVAPQTCYRRSEARRNRRQP
jgi:hypothetical protein